MASENESIRQIEEIARGLVKEQDLDFDVFRLVHRRREDCEVKQEIGPGFRITDAVSSEDSPKKRLICRTHNVVSKWVHIDY